MKSNHITEIITDYLDGLLNADQHKEAEAHLRNCKSCSAELKETRELLKAFGKEENIAPSKRLKDRFYHMLEEEKQHSAKVIPINQKNNRISALLKIAAGIALLIGAFSLGKFQQQQQSNLTIAALENKSLEIKETAMLSLMENQSASRRIQGVNYIEEFTEPDEAIIKALADRMLYDDNKNVRLSAVEAMGKFTTSATVKEAFISALETENDPSIQITIIQILVAIQEKKAIAPMQKLLQLQETQPFVKKEIRTLLPNII